MLNARHSFTLLWKRLVAALSLIAAAALAPPVSAPVGGAGPVGPRMGNGAALASAANASIANVAGLVEGGQHKLPAGTSGDPQTKAPAPAACHVIAVLRPAVAAPPREARALLPTHAARSGPTRAPPLA